MELLSEELAAPSPQRSPVNLTRAGPDAGMPLRGASGGAGDGVGLRSLLLRPVAAQPFQAFGRPDLVDLIKLLERGHTFGQIQPRHFAPREDVNVGSDRVRSIERPGAHEQEVTGRAMVAAPYVGPATAAKEHLVGLSAAPGQPE